MKGCLCISYFGKYINNRTYEDDERFKEDLRKLFCIMKAILGSYNLKRDEDF